MALRADADLNVHNSDRSNEDDLLELYRTMMRIRAFEEAALRLRIAGEFTGAVHPCVGHEAIAAGVGAALRPSDWVGGYYRSHGHAIVKGCDPAALMAELYGRSGGVCKGRSGSMHMIDLERRFLGASAIVAAGIPHAAGAALAAQLAGEGDVAVAFFGDGATGAGPFHETMNIAAAQRLPMLFVCENNLYQDHTRAEDVTPSTELVRYGEGHLMPAERVDGADVLAVRDAAARAVARARAGDGPSFLEATTYLTYYHCVLDMPPAEYRPADEVATWAARDPVLHARRRLQEAGVPRATLRRIADDADDEVRRAVDFARSSEPLPLSEASTDVYSHR